MTMTMDLGVLERAYATTAGLVAHVGGGDLDRPTPCASWTVRGLLDHVMLNTVRFPAMVAAGKDGDRTERAVPSWEADPVGSFRARQAAVLAAFAEPTACEGTVLAPFGLLPATRFLWIAASDTFVHGWDLAAALGRSTDLDPELAEALWSFCSSAITGAFRGADGAAPFGPEVPARPGATPADRLAALLGRAR